MNKYHVVGEKMSFTHLACIERYGKQNKVIDGYTFDKLVEKVKKKKLKDDTAVIPLWNSNFGTIAFKVEKEEITAGLLKGVDGRIIDAWGTHIPFHCATKDGKFSTKRKVYSVKVAQGQCSNFLKKHKLELVDGGCSTTTEAFKKYTQSIITTDTVLCSPELLKLNNVVPIKKSVQNPLNFTVFFSFNKKLNLKPKYSLCCFLMDLQGSVNVPIEFTNYWRELIESMKVKKTSELFNGLPRIIFVLRYKNSKVLVLAEMPVNNGNDDPWLRPDFESGIESFPQVGGTHKSIASETCALAKALKNSNQRAIFYGHETYETYFWACPELNTVVQGADQKLVQNFSKLQVNTMVSLKEKYGLVLNEKINKLLNAYIKNNEYLLLGPKSVHSRPI